ncbi:class II aldolase/adducin family protein [Falsiroseomonas sp. HC035]|uniref:class II aldolase/adducin family protein n=1 Tax=Falsiroseomonas sp. HC035 TaxID=3390999 RepID=UPI003D32368C
MSLLCDAELHLAHHYEEGNRIARALGDKSVMVMRGHGATVVGPNVHDAFDECFIAWRTAMYRMTAMSTGQPLHTLPDRLRRTHLGRWGEKIDARLHLDAWRRYWIERSLTAPIRRPYGMKRTSR